MPNVNTEVPILTVKTSIILNNILLIICFTKDGLGRENLSECDTVESNALAPVPPGGGGIRNPMGRIGDAREELEGVTRRV